MVSVLGALVPGYGLFEYFGESVTGRLPSKEEVAKYLAIGTGIVSGVVALSYGLKTYAEEKGRQYAMED